MLDASALARDLRAALVRGSIGASVSPKVSVAIDGGGRLSLDEIAADVRLRAEMSECRAAFRVGLGGDGASAVDIGVVPPARGSTLPSVSSKSLRGVAAMRARDVLATEGLAPFRAALASAGGFCELPSPAGERKRGEPVGAHRLHDGSLAYGVGLAFGHADATSLRRLIEAASSAGASGVRAAPGPGAHDRWRHARDGARICCRCGAVRLHHARRRSAPLRHRLCRSAGLRRRAHRRPRHGAGDRRDSSAASDRSFTIHVSGCAKGCAYPRAAALTVVGTPEGCALIADGSALDIPHAVVSADELPAAIARSARTRTGDSGHV